VEDARMWALLGGRMSTFIMARRVPSTPLVRTAPTTVNR